jgi:hypothetical protein
MTSDSLNKPPAPSRAEIRPKEAAERIGCSVGYVYALLSEGAVESRVLARTMCWSTSPLQD